MIHSTQFSCLGNLSSMNTIIQFQVHIQISSVTPFVAGFYFLPGVQRSYMASVVNNKIRHLKQQHFKILGRNLVLKGIISCHYRGNMLK